MAPIEKEIKELRQLLSDFSEGKVKPKEVQVKISIYGQLEKRANLMLKAYAMSLQKPILSKLIESNICYLGDGEVIEIEPESAKETSIFEKSGESPCLADGGCEFKDRDKNHSECVNCKKRIKYTMS